MLRSSLRTRVSGTRFVSRLSGDLDGSTACRVLAAVARAPAHVRDLVVDLGGVRTVESFGLDVLARGIPASARGRPVRVLWGPAVSKSAPPGQVDQKAGARRTAS
jgi:anti-anti-sigma regulatory factor